MSDKKRGVCVVVNHSLSIRDAAAVDIDTPHTENAQSIIFFTKSPAIALAF